MNSARSDLLAAVVALAGALGCSSDSKPSDQAETSTCADPATCVNCVDDGICDTNYDEGCGCKDCADKYFCTGPVDGLAQRCFHACDKLKAAVPGANVQCLTLTSGGGEPIGNSLCSFSCTDAQAAAACASVGGTCQPAFSSGLGFCLLGPIDPNWTACSSYVPGKMDCETECSKMGKTCHRVEYFGPDCLGTSVGANYQCLDWDADSGSATHFRCYCT